MGKSDIADIGSMLAAQYNENSNDASRVKIVSVPKPQPEPGLAVVRVHAAASNPIDYKVMGGYLKGAGWAMPLPFTPGYDFSGEVSALDDSDANGNVRVGDEVFAVNWGQGQHDENGVPSVGGAFAQYIKIPLSRLSLKPPGISHAEAAAVSLVGSTAYQALFNHLRIGEGSRVLVLGGSTAVGSMAIQLAKDAGAWVATTCSKRTKSYVESFGCSDAIIDYNAERWEENKSVTEHSIDAVFDCAGDDNAFQRSKIVLKEDGGFLSIASFDVGFDPNGHPPLSYAAFMCLCNNPEHQDKLSSMVASKKLKVVIADVFPFTDEGLKMILSKQMEGKLCGKAILSIANN
eukprot:CAMPEP_0183307282 /NCGR_PEP_ID=MMETSP0160_2-20130417/17236_1 /TAXON_ID=2839 ORGANISM="Odontella Sinensis, Strain Grunow 1884" /NCGR_SAMPLE_ID=MMETSP0160_2 /ASSEMBLY_ACC=CAM_ASM_000250 /LENGTH=346 /DNA_ID=CAMNT_0025470835 /DNA_START=57 /DNA_END=1097 /DNA_ORIENTATION=-